ncbi:MAG TPA: o-succinylbenzoate synthase [Ktedonobacteraceae bacterium]
MQLLDLNWSRYRVPFRSAFHTAHGSLSHRSGALIAARIDDGRVGYGEIAPLPTHNGYSLEESLSTLPRLARALRGQELPDLLRSLATWSADEQLPAPLVCGLETALLDAYGQACGLRVADVLASNALSAQGSSPAAAVYTGVPVNAVISATTTEAALTSARVALAAGFTCLKLKLTDASPGAIERVAAVRAALGAAPRLRLDANASWQSEQARDLLVQCAPYDIEYVEQPLPTSDLYGMAELRRVSPIPLAADEALSGLASARRILRAQAADVLILKPQLAGGLQVCRRIIQEAAAQGVDCVITSTLESGIGVTAALHLAAASPAITRPCGLATLALLENDLLDTSLPIQRGTIELPAASGLGVYPNLAALKRFIF